MKKISLQTVRSMTAAVVILGSSLTAVAGWYDNALSFGKNWLNRAALPAPAPVVVVPVVPASRLQRLYEGAVKGAQYVASSRAGQAVTNSASYVANSRAGKAVANGASYVANSRAYQGTVSGISKVSEAAKAHPYMAVGAAATLVGGAALTAVTARWYFKHEVTAPEVAMAKRFAQLAKQALEKLVALEKQQDEFLATKIDETRNPLIIQEARIIADGSQFDAVRNLVGQFVSEYNTQRAAVFFHNKTLNVATMQNLLKELQALAAEKTATK